MKLIKTITALFLLCAGQVFAQSGVITELSGTVELKPAGAADYVPAKTGDIVEQDTLVSTGFKSSALITVGSSAIIVRPLTRLILAEISSTGIESVNVSLQTGRVRVDVKPPAGSRADFKIQSPEATASVRGTSFDFDFQSLRVLEGTVDYQGSEGKTMQIKAGFGSSIKENGKASSQIENYLAELQPSLPLGTIFDAGDYSDLRGGMGFDFSFPEYSGDLEFELTWPQ